MLCHGLAPMDTDRGGANRIGVNGDDGVDVGGVAAAHRDGDRQAGAAGTRASDDLVAPAQSVDGELEAAEPIAFVRIGAGKIEDEVRLMPVQDRRRDARVSSDKVVVVTGAIGERRRRDR